MTVTENDISTDNQVFLLSVSEAEQYFDSDAARACKPTAFAEAKGKGLKANVTSFVTETWWLRSPGFYGGQAAIVSASGHIGIGSNVYFNYLVRPAMWIDLG